MKVNLMFGILSLIVISVLTDKRDIMKNSKVESWISTENFTTMIKKSFLYSTCCNIYLSGSYARTVFLFRKNNAQLIVIFLLDPIYDVEVLFHQFINIYPHEYLLHRIFYECQGYFLLGPTDEEIEKAMRV